MKDKSGPGGMTGAMLNGQVEGIINKFTKRFYYTL
jgi:hypothetical protein